ncbi:GNAT family N-acetyltransferase, partial [Lactiplantibacillus plantarum]|nr:GNAT family N-acetyltransferase [Lactiplantibacillus plantarum]
MIRPTKMKIIFSASPANRAAAYALR